MLIYDVVLQLRVFSRSAMSGWITVGKPGACWHENWHTAGRSPGALGGGLLFLAVLLPGEGCLQQGWKHPQILLSHIQRWPSA